MKNERIYLSLADMGGQEQRFVKEAFDTNWVVPLGPNVDAFERELAAFVGRGCHAVALSSGTAAIHLALLMLNVGKGDEVVCQSFTFAASANPIVYCGASPVFVDSEAGSWNMDSQRLEEAIVDRKSKTGKYPKAVVAVHLYGMPANMDAIQKVAARYGIPIVEDAAEAIGSVYNGFQCGTYGTFGALSFNGNKMITTSGGGALLCRMPEEAERVKFYATQAKENRPYYYHEHIGYNYRLSNVSAGIGRGQLLVLADHIARRRAIHALYVEGLKGVPGIRVQQNPSEKYDSNFWLTCVQLDPNETALTPEGLRLALEQANIESRRFWYPMHLQPIYKGAPFYGAYVAERLFERGLCLPSGSSLTDEAICRVVEEIKKVAKQR